MNYKHAVLACFLLMSVPVVSKGQQDEEEDVVNGAPNPGDNPTNAPFDGGLSLLVAAGIAYGAKKGYDKKKKDKADVVI